MGKALSSLPLAKANGDAEQKRNTDFLQPSASPRLCAKPDGSVLLRPPGRVWPIHPRD